MRRPRPRERANPGETWGNVGPARVFPGKLGNAATARAFPGNLGKPVLAAAADGAILAGPGGATPPMLSGGEWRLRGVLVE